MEHGVLSFKENVHNFAALNNAQPTCNFEITHLAHKIFEFVNCELGYGQDNPGLNSWQRQEIVLFSKTFRLVVGVTQPSSVSTNSSFFTCLYCSH